MFRVFRKKNEGFTLVELMVVVLIIGILVAIAIPVFNSARANAQTGSCKANLRTMDGAYQTWISQQPGTYVAPATFALEMAQLVPNYLKATPTCPAAGTYSFAAPSNSCSVAGHVFP